MAKSNYAYIPVLDGLRGVSILLVFIAHIGFENIVPGGLGVTIFFFISGYIITSLLINEYERTATVNMKSFYVRRLLRLYPPLLFMIILFFSYLFYIHKPINYQEILASVFYYENYYFFFNPTSCSSICKILWSLAVEEHFYLVFPFIFLLLVKSPKALLVTLLTLICLPLVFRCIGAVHYEYSQDMTERYCYVMTHTRFDSIMYGCLSSIVLHLFDSKVYKKVLSNKIAFIASIVVLLACLFIRDNMFRNTTRYSLQGMALFIIIPALVNVNAYQKIANLLSNKFILFIGKLSYSIYLTHMLAITVLLTLKASGHPALYYLSVTALTALLSITSYYLVERPFRAIKKKFRAKKVSAEAYEHSTATIL